MKKGKDVRVVLVTSPNLPTARRIAGAILAKRLVACVNLLPGIESHYHWKGEVETAKEVLMLMKTTASLVAELEQTVLACHPYDTAEFVTLPVDAVTEKYLGWWMAETKEPEKQKRKKEGR